MGELSVRQQQMLRRLCRCADRQGPPISAVGSPQPPPYARSPSLEFHTPPIKVCPIEDAETPPPQTSPLPVPPPAPESPTLFSDAENIPPVRNVTKIPLFRPISLNFSNLCFVILFCSPSLR